MKRPTTSSRGRHRGLLAAVTFLVVAVLATGRPLLSEEAPVWGTASADAAVELQPQVALGPISIFRKFAGAGYATGGVGLHHQAAGGIVISGVTKPVKAAFIYWAVISQGPPTAASKGIMVQRLAPGAASATVNLNGTVIGTGPQPCWGGDRITVLRAQVPNSVANGNGLYKVTLRAGAAGNTSGADPWATLGLPLFEGASLVVVGTGNGNVAIYDKGLAAATFLDTLTYVLPLPVAATGTQTLWDSIGANGQLGIGRAAILAAETTEINGFPVAGPNSATNDGDWNGGAGGPLPQLWDNTGHDITPATPPATPALGIEFTGNPGQFKDCVTPVANVVLVR